MYSQSIYMQSWAEDSENSQVYDLHSYPPVPSQPRILMLSKMPITISTPMRMITIHSKAGCVASILVLADHIQ